MALKEKALRRLGEKLSAANIPFAAGGEWLHCQLGQSAVYHTFDIVVSSADAARADKVLTKLGMRQEQPAPDGVFRCHYHFDGADYLTFPRAYERVTPEEIQNFLAQTVVPERAALCIVEPRRDAT